METIRKIECYQTIVKDEPGEAYKLLNVLQSLGVNLLAFNVIPIGAETAELMLFPDDPDTFKRVASDANLHVVGPHSAFLVTGDDELGVIADIHRRLFEGQINVESSAGVTDGQGGFGYVIYVRTADFDAASEVLGL